MNEKGNLSINSENFLPIIKKWLYTDKDIFIRELVSNACDAVTKLKKLMIMGEADHIPADEAFSVHVVLNKEEKIMQIVDNGIGMTTEQIEQLLNPEESPKNRRGLNGIGISNINQRIKMTYGQEYGISITSKPGAYTDVLICIPYERSTSL